MGFFDLFKAKKEDDIESEVEEGYVELDTDSQGELKSKIIVRPFVMKDFESIKPVLDALRQGKTIALVNIRPLKDKDLIELKRAISKLKKTTEAIDGEIAGFGEDYIVIAPSFAQIYRTKETSEVKAEAGMKDDSDME
jgi:SepF-like predicted cell division protein (DUF552 family)